jgi:hypothetical protein
MLDRKPLHSLAHNKAPHKNAFWRLAVIILTMPPLQGLPARADSLSHSLAVSAAIRGSSLESDVQAAENIEHIAKKVRPVHVCHSIRPYHTILKCTRQSAIPTALETRLDNSSGECLACAGSRSGSGIRPSVASAVGHLGAPPSPPLRCAKFRIY